MRAKLFLYILIAGFFNMNLTAQNGTFTLTSNDLGGQFSLKQVYDQYDCGGQNMSPQLMWKNAPAGTKSFAVTMFDPDAPTGSGWWHWLIFNIPENINELPSDAGNTAHNLLPASVIQSLNDYGAYGYGGPCPPKGDKPHRYIITVYALKVGKIDLNKDSRPATVGFYLNRFAIAKSSIIAYYQR